ncbi:MAG: hypothetical protein P8J79_06335 [Halioglobus sp.]|nr:hypothetical protein [Halioglobus sp.]
MIVLYVGLAALAITQGDTSAGIWAVRVLVILAVVHLIETAVFFKFCKAAGGSLGGNLLSVFLFGVLHVKELKAAQGDS